MKASLSLILGLSVITQAQAIPLPKQAIKSYNCKTCLTFSHTSLSKSWPIRNHPLSEDFNNQQKSFSYRQTVTLDALQKGVPLSIMGIGAVIRVSPLTPQKDLPEFIIKSKQDTLTLKDASDAAVGGAFKLKDSLGSGAFILSTTAKNTNAKQIKYMVSVLDNNSAFYLAVQTDKSHYQYGDVITTTINFPEDDFDEPVTDVSGFLLKPNSDKVPLTFTKVTDGEYTARMTLNDETNWDGENGYIHAEITGFIDDNGVKRQAQTAFSYSLPSATVTSVDKLGIEPLMFNASVDVATNSRYALTAVLYHKDSKGKLLPIEITQTSQWLNKGDHKIALNFETAVDNPEDYALGYIQLVDYGQMKPVFRYNQPIVLSQLK